MGQIADYVKENFTPSEGITLEEVEKLEKDLDPLSGLTTPDQALDFMGRNPLFEKALKKHETQAIEKHDAKYSKEKLPGLLKEHGDKIRAEINPKETDEQKANREMREEIDALKNEKISDKLKTDLLTTAKEIGYTGDIDLFMSKGDKAIETMEAYHEGNTKYLDGKLEEMKKGVYKGNTPPNAGDPVVPKDIDEQIMEARKAGDFNLAMRLQMQKQNTKPQQ